MESLIWILRWTESEMYPGNILIEMSLYRFLFVPETLKLSLRAFLGAQLWRLMRAYVSFFLSQSHSSQNRFRRSNDIKSNLILTTLSWIDYLRPDYVYFENVPGFLRYNLMALQKDRYTLTGGIEVGGLRLLTQALLRMGYASTLIYFLSSSQ
jgi:hypothetical protein